MDERSARRREIKQGRQCKYNVIFRPFRATIFAVEKHQVLHIVSVCSLSYPACSAHAPNYHLCPVRIYVFPHYL